MPVASLPKDERLGAAVTPRPDSFAVIATGGTGGHVYPALALAGVLASRGHPPATLRFVGGRRGLEARAAGEAGFAIDTLPGRGFRRALTLENVVAAWEAVVAFVGALRIVRRLAPSVAVGFGGYASLPTLVAARVLRIPAVVHEQNAAPGLANRVAVRLGAVAAISLPDTPIPDAVLTGNPVRPEILAVRRAPEAVHVIGIVGGSLGARTLNDAALDLYERWRHRDDVSIRHVSGSRDHEACRRRLDELAQHDDRLAYELVAYEDDMPGLYSRASVIVARAGASTVAEIAAVGVPSVLVPLPGSPGAHQERNAAALCERGAAVVVDDSLCTGTRLDTELTALLADAERMTAMSAAAASIAHRDAGERLADLVEEHARAR